MPGMRVRACAVVRDMLGGVRAQTKRPNLFVAPIVFSDFFCACVCVCALGGGGGKVSRLEKHSNVAFDDKGITCGDSAVCWGIEAESGKAVVWGAGGNNACTGQQVCARMQAHPHALSRHQGGGRCSKEEKGGEGLACARAHVWEMCWGGGECWGMSRCKRSITPISCLIFFLLRDLCLCWQGF